MPDNQAIVIQQPDTSHFPVVQFQTIMALAVTDDKTCAAATEYAKAAKAYIAEVDSTFEEACDLANKTHKHLTGMRASFKERAEAAYKHCRKQIEDYLARKERERLELQAKLQREADEETRKEAEERRKAEMEEIKRRQEEAAQQHLKEIEDLPPWEQADAPAAEGEHLQAQLEELAAAPLVVQAPQVVLSPVAPAVEGLGTRKGKLTYEVADFNALVQAAAKNPALQDYLQVNDKMVKAKLATVGEKIGEFVPGIKPKRDAGIVIK
jgi:DNA repair exonuclease SbcCD ATPase subunit